jgi:Tol biopolymer transport system component
MLILLTILMSIPKQGIAGAPAWHAPGPLPEPELFAEGTVSTGGFESHPCFTPDGATLYFVRSTPQFTDWKIWETHLADGTWTTPQMAPFSGTHRDADPFLTADGQRLYFISDRPVDGKPREDMDVWVMERTAQGAWGEPRNLGAPVNSPGNEWFPTIAASGNLYFGSDRPGGFGATDLYRARPGEGGYGEPENLGAAVNSEADEYEPCIAPDESFLVYMAAGRPDSQGSGDLYISFREKDGWSAARNLGPKINRPGMEISAYLSPGGRYVYFSSCRWTDGKPLAERPDRARNGLGDIYRMDLAALLDLGRAELVKPADR